MGWIKCGEHNVLCCDICGECPECSDFSGFAVGDGYSQPYYLCPDCKKKHKDKIMAGQIDSFCVEVGKPRNSDILQKRIF